MAQDYCDHVNLISRNSFGGMLGHNNVVSMDSNEQRVQPVLPGMTFEVHPKEVNNRDASKLTCAFWRFPGTFVHGAAWHARDLGFDSQECMERHTWPVRIIEKAPFGRWWAAFIADTTQSGPLFGKNMKIGVNEGGRDGPIFADAERIVGDESLDDHKAFLESLTPEQAVKYKHSLALYPDMKEWGDMATNPGNVGYNWPRLHYGMLLAYSLYGADEDLKVKARQYMDLLDEHFPLDQGDYWGYTRGQIAQQTAYLAHDKIK
jgi:hypothetical protein